MGWQVNWPFVGQGDWFAEMESKVGWSLEISSHPTALLFSEIGHMIKWEVWKADTSEWVGKLRKAGREAIWWRGAESSRRTKDQANWTPLMYQGTNHLPVWLLISSGPQGSGIAMDAARSLHYCSFARGKWQNTKRERNWEQSEGNGLARQPVSRDCVLIMEWLKRHWLGR